MTAVLSGRSVPVTAKPDTYALEAARVKGQRAAEAGEVCLVPLDLNEAAQGAWLDGYMDAYKKANAQPKAKAARLPRLVVLAHAWPSPLKKTEQAQRPAPPVRGGGDAMSPEQVSTAVSCVLNHARSNGGLVTHHREKPPGRQHDGFVLVTTSAAIETAVVKLLILMGHGIEKRLTENDT